MYSRSVQLRIETEQKIREHIPYIHTDADMAWITDWFLMMGLAMVKQSLEKHPQLSIGDLINMTMLDKLNVN
jgi:hypothetical protein